MALMPRVLPYSVLGASTINTIATEIENQGRTCRVRRSAAQSITSGVRTPVAWQLEDWDTNGGGMWAPSNTYLTVQVPGTYLIVGQVRWDDVGGSGSNYRTGMRNAYITVNSTDPSGSSVCKGAQSQYAANSLNGEGQTLQVHAKEALQPNDRIYLIVSQDCGATIVGCHQNFGGTFLDATRLSAIA